MNTEIFKKQNRFLMLALDHRESFKGLLNPEEPESVVSEEIVDLKRAIIKSLAGLFSGLLIDPEYGLPAYEGLRIHSPYLLCMEESSYEGEENERYTRVQYSAKELKALGASGAKLLLYFNPFNKAAQVQLEVGRRALIEAHESDLPLFLEIVTYNTGPEQSRSTLVSESVKVFIDSEVVPDVWKLEYPGDAASCKEITRLVGSVPWILLTGGCSFAEFTKWLPEAIQGGAVGFLAGRGLWREVATYRGREKEKFLKEILPQRFKKISEIAIG